jgi:hypothetical protein
MLVGRERRHCEPAVPRGTARRVASEAWNFSDIEAANMSRVTVAVDDLLAVQTIHFAIIAVRRALLARSTLSTFDDDPSPQNCMCASPPPCLTASYLPNLHPGDHGDLDILPISSRWRPVESSSLDL